MALIVSLPVRPSMPSVLKPCSLSALNFLDLVQGRHAFSSGELLAEGQITADFVAKVAERQGVTRGRIVGIDRTKILTDQECWPVGDR